MQPKLKVFVSHSFDANDSDDIAQILAFLRAPKFHFEVVTARSPEAEQIGSKVERFVGWADVTFGIFTKRYRDDASEVYVPPPYVLTECAYAKGQYAGNPFKGVHGLVESGVKHSDLALLAVSGEEFPLFRREQFRRGETRAIEQFLMTLHKRYGQSGLAAPKRPYKQREVRKTVEILRNGTAVFKHTVTIAIHHPESIIKRGVLHQLWAPMGAPDLPALEEMARVPLVKRHEQATFSCACIRKNEETVNIPMEIKSLRREASWIQFRLAFPFQTKSNDVLCYQYLWSLPRAFPTCEEDLKTQDYNEVSLRTPHGPITEAIVKLKFEREVVHGAAPELFSKKPFLTYSLTHVEDGFAADEPTPVPLVEYDATWEIYQASIPNLQNAVTLKWRPSSRATIRNAIRAATMQVGSRSSEVAAVAIRGRKRMASIRGSAGRSRRQA
jgi:hypothetical protein